MTTVGGNEVFRELLAEGAADAAEVRAKVARFRQDKIRPSLRYRCDGGGSGRSGCLLLAVWPTPRGPVVFRPAQHFTVKDALQQLIDPDLAGAAFPLAWLPPDGVVRLLVACDRRIIHLWPGQVRADLAAAGQIPRVILLPDGNEAGIYR